MTINDLYAILQGDAPSMRVSLELISLLGIVAPVCQGDMTVITGKTSLQNFIETHQNSKETQCLSQPCYSDNQAPAKQPAYAT